MPHIEVDENLPGIRALMAFRPETAAAMGALVNILLRDKEGLSMAEREMVATYVSSLNDCFYCRHSHGAITALYLQGDFALVEDVCNNYHKAAISEKMKSLLTIAASVQKGGKHVTAEQVDQARRLGASDRDIHDTVLIAAAFCMFNRYVDGLAATTPGDLSTYPTRAKQIIENGYGNHIFLDKQPVAEPLK